MFALHPSGAARSTTSDVADAIYPAPAVEADAASQAERAVRASHECLVRATRGMSLIFLESDTHRGCVGGWSVGAGFPLPVHLGVYLADGGRASVDESFKLNHDETCRNLQIQEVVCCIGRGVRYVA